jgi:acetyl esterase/lipase
MSQLESLATQTTSPSTNADGVVFRDIPIGKRSRFIVWLMRCFLKPMLGGMARAKSERIAKIQLRISSMPWPKIPGVSIDYDIVGRVPGHVMGRLEAGKRPVILWLHGGAFFLPAAPNAHLTMVAQLCCDLQCDAFLPDYRLAPANPFPASLDDCENAYRALLDIGYPPSQIVVGGDSAGGNLLLALLTRLRRNQLPMPACAVPVSPVTELGRAHSPLSRASVQKSDPLLPAAAFQGIVRDYVGTADSADPEVSPLFMDCDGLPPLYFLASSNEILMDDSVLLARRMLAAGVSVRCHVWPVLPHAFPLFESYFAEAAQAREDIAAFIREHV